VAVNNNVRKILKKKGYRVDQATSKAEALEKIDQRDYRLVLLDLKMPGVKGLELLEAIRNVQPQARVIIITGYASIETAVQTARMGAVDYIPKPFTPDEIRSATENAIRLAAWFDLSGFPPSWILPGPSVDRVIFSSLTTSAFLPVFLYRLSGFPPRFTVPGLSKWILFCFRQGSWRSAVDFDWSPHPVTKTTKILGLQWRSIYGHILIII
jgi:CheY-like chemotaxis protein